jgi:hypothetical protein
MQTPQELDRATLLTALYCLVDDLYQEHFASLKPTRRGHRPELSDSEVLTLTLLGQWQPDRSERGFLAYAMAHLHPYFPRLLSQSAFNRRARDLMGVLCALVPLIRQRALEVLKLPQSAFEVLDAVPVPLMRICRGKLHRLYRDEAAIGRGGSDRGWYYGVKLLGEFDAYGFLSGFLTGPANTEDRWLAEGFFRWQQDPTAPPPAAAQLAPVLGPAHRAGGERQGPTGPTGPREGVGWPSEVPAIADLDYSGAGWGQHWRSDYEAVVLTAAAYRTLPEPERRRAARWLQSLRQVAETGFNKLIEVFGLAFPRARSRWGLHTRLGAKAAAYNFALYLNHLLGRPPFSDYNPLA